MEILGDILTVLVLPSPFWLGILAGLLEVYAEKRKEGKDDSRID